MTNVTPQDSVSVTMSEAPAGSRYSKPSGPIAEACGDVLAITEGSAAIADVVAAAHVGSSLPACSRTMYSAYQSGQFASCWPRHSGYSKGLASGCGFKQDSRSHAASRSLPKQNIENNPMQSTRQLPGRTLWANA